MNSWQFGYLLEEITLKKLGILGGMGPESTLLYYKEVADKFKARDVNGYFPALTIETVNMYEMLGYCKAEQYDLLAEYLLSGIRNLEKSGADFIIMASNTPHVVFDRLEQEAQVPLISIVEPTCQVIRKQGFKKVAWLGIKFTMEQPYFKKRFIENGIDVIVPCEEERNFIDTVIAKELEFGIVNENSKKEISRIIQNLVTKEGAQAIILGCTELPLMYSGETFSVPVYDTLSYHIEEIVAYMFNE